MEITRDPPQLIRRSGYRRRRLVGPSADPLTADVTDIVASPFGDLYVFGVTDFPGRSRVLRGAPVRPPVI